MAKKNSLIRSTFDASNNVLTLSVGNEATGNIGTIEIALRNLNAEVTTLALVHGLVQKVSDAAAMPKDELPDNPIEAAKVKLAAMTAVAERITGEDGTWSANRGDGSGPVSGLIFRAFSEWAQAMAAKRKKDVPTEEQLRAVYDAKSRADQLALRSVPEIAAIIDRIKAERGSAGSKVDADGLLGELGL